jgi:hypothetical protein
MERREDARTGEVFALFDGFFWWLVGCTSCTLYCLLVITFGGLHLFKRREPWLEGFRVSLVCLCRLHVCMQKM